MEEEKKKERKKEKKRRGRRGKKEKRTFSKITESVTGSNDLRSVISRAGKEKDSNFVHITRNPGRSTGEKG